MEDGRRKTEDGSKSIGKNFGLQTSDFGLISYNMSIQSGNQIFFRLSLYY
jgi:hypothetical protein